MGNYNEQGVWEEISTDPEEIGYATPLATDDYQGVADLLNLAQFEVRRYDITHAEILLALSTAACLAEVAALNIQKETRFNRLVDLLVGGSLPFNGEVADWFKTIFAVETNCYAALIDLKFKTASRAYVLGWPIVDAAMVQQAAAYGASL